MRISRSPCSFAPPPFDGFATYRTSYIIVSICFLRYTLLIECQYWKSIVWAIHVDPRNDQFGEIRPHGRRPSRVLASAHDQRRPRTRRSRHASCARYDLADHSTSCQWQSFRVTYAQGTHGDQTGTKLDRPVSWRLYTRGMDTHLPRATPHLCARTLLIPSGSMRSQRKGGTITRGALAWTWM